MAKAASKSTRKGSAKKHKAPLRMNAAAQPLYSPPDIIMCGCGGKLTEMKSMSLRANKHIAYVKAQLAKLEQAIAKAGG